MLLSDRYYSFHLSRREIKREKKKERERRRKRKSKRERDLKFLYKYPKC